jgi:ATPase subunit of ABC transporter with duplicated ATPase domains
MNAALRIAVVGAAGSGKTQLASALGTACSQAAQAVLIADNPPLTAVRQSGIELTLLMGLDLAATGAARPEREAADQALRQALAQAGLSYTVI